MLNYLNHKVDVSIPLLEWNSSAILVNDGWLLERLDCISPLGRGHSLIWPMRVCGAEQGMIFTRRSWVLNRVFLFIIIIPQILGASAAHLYPNFSWVPPPPPGFFHGWTLIKASILKLVRLKIKAFHFRRNTSLIIRPRLLAALRSLPFLLSPVMEKGDSV